MGINFAYARKKFSEAQQKLRKEYKAAGMTDEQILEMYEYDLHQFNRDLAYQRHTQRLGILEEPDMEEEGHNPLLHKFIDALTVYQQPTEDAKFSGATWIPPNALFRIITTICAKRSRKQFGRIWTLTRRRKPIHWNMLRP